MLTPFSIWFAAFVVCAVFAIAHWVVTKDDAETQQAERDAINRKVAAHRVTEGRVLSLRRNERMVP